MKKQEFNLFEEKDEVWFAYKGKLVQSHILGFTIIGNTGNTAVVWYTVEKIPGDLYNIIMSSNELFKTKLEALINTGS